VVLDTAFGGGRRKQGRQQKGAVGGGAGRERVDSEPENAVIVAEARGQAEHRAEQEGRRQQKRGQKRKMPENAAAGMVDRESDRRRMEARRGLAQARGLSGTAAKEGFQFLSEMTMAQFISIEEGIREEQREEGRVAAGKREQEEQEAARAGEENEAAGNGRAEEQETLHMELGGGVITCADETRARSTKEDAGTEALESRLRGFVWLMAPFSAAHTEDLWERGKESTTAARRLPWSSAANSRSCWKNGQSRTDTSQR
jgi:hypothetical protein